MSSAIKISLVVLGFLASALILAQLVMGLLIVNGAEQKLRTMHQHSGYLTVTVVLVYILFSLSKIAGLPTKSADHAK